MIGYASRLIVFGIGAILLLALGIGYLVGMSTGVPETPQAERLDRPDVTFDAAPAQDGVPGYQEVYVNDYADLLDPDAERVIREQLTELYDRTGIEMTVLTIEAKSDYGFDGTIEDFATRLFNTWGIGNADLNDGVLVLVSRYDRQMRIELGAGYGDAWDGRAQSVIDDHFLPDFRRERYQEGILEGVAETVAMVGGVHPDDHDLGTLGRGWAIIGRWASGLGALLFPLVVAPLAALAFAFQRAMRSRPRDCPACGTRMIRMGEEADDAHLDGGQRLEEYLKSVDYDVHRCPSCAHMTITRHRNWFSKYGTCPTCNYRTLETDSTITSQATTTSTGTRRIDYMCHNCDYRDSETRTIPKKSDSSSGSGRSSFGGGRSSGGGASGGW